MIYTIKAIHSNIEHIDSIYGTLKCNTNPSYNCTKCGKWLSPTNYDYDNSNKFPGSFTKPIQYVPPKIIRTRFNWIRGAIITKDKIFDQYKLNSLGKLKIINSNISEINNNVVSSKLKKLFKSEYGENNVGDIIKIIIPYYLQDLMKLRLYCKICNMPDWWDEKQDIKALNMIKNGEAEFCHIPNIGYIVSERFKAIIENNNYFNLTELLR